MGSEVQMSLFCRLLCVGCLAATLVPRASAQMPSATNALPPESTLESWLSSEDPRLVAWGAHDVLVARDSNLTPQLVTLASRWQPLSLQTSDNSPYVNLSSEQKDQRDAMAAVLDALIQMNVALPTDTLRNLAPDFGNDVAILLSRMPEEESGALSFDFYRSPPVRDFSLQYVSAALLALHPPAGFAADLLSSISVQANVLVVLPGSEQFGGGEGGSSFGGVPGRPRENWPMTGQYQLTKQKSDGASLVVAGIDPIYALRSESTHFLPESSSIGMYLGPEQRLRLIAEMLGVPREEIHWHTMVSTTIEFQSPEQYERELLVLVEEERAKHRATAAALADRNLLSLAEAEQSLPDLKLKIRDRRGEGALPNIEGVLPPSLDPPNLPARVEWSFAP
jgi:hypothetical protein